MSLSILEGASRKRKHDISETETNSVKHKKSKKQRGKSESESDVDSIVDDEFERNSVLGFKHRRMENEKLWNKSVHPETVQDKYDVLISDDLKKVEDNIPPLSVYIGSGFAAEVKSFRKTFYLSFSKSDIEKRKKFINIPLTELNNVIAGLRVIEKHVRKNTK
ncbi:hypothetical protein AVEN_179659-1 [Araneus ventricosus]|uniref:Uncharacterized protein n=1 Tax=Araneus ventricosus TaxID=182803 RepID=A0A4Y2U059_ARAVE|nr:hypothetical protein AVEN_14972-1 [Araneus ventricosus]GBO05962.1 hypothetical protein AVEN_179659-1 [Araneus ventricosus]